VNMTLIRISSWLHSYPRWTQVEIQVPSYGTLRETLGFPFRRRMIRGFQATLHIMSLLE
jgi:hypothetical protein